MVLVDTQGYGSVAVDTGYGTATVTQVASLPTSSANSFTIGNLGSGLQLTNLTLNGRSWNFDEAPFLRVLLYSGVGDPREAPFNVGDLGTPAIVQDSTSFTIIWDTANLGRVAIQGQFVVDRLELACEVALQGIAANIFRLWGYDFPYLRVKAYEHSTRTDTRLILTQAGGLTIVDPTQALPDAVYPHGYEVRHPEDLPYPIDQTDVGNTPAAMKWMAITHRGKRTGLVMRSTEHPLGKQPLTGWTFDSDGDGTVYMWERHYPPDNVLTAVSYTLPYKVHLAPLPDEWYGCSKWYREKVEAEAPPWLPAKIKDDSTGRMPAFVKNAKVVLWYALIYGADRAASIAKCLLQVQRAVSHFGTGVVLFLYRWKTTSDTENWPDTTPLSDVITLAAQCRAAGASVIIYTIDDRWDPSSQFAGDNPTFIDYVAFDAFQNPSIATLGSTPASQHYMLNYIHTTGRTLLQAQNDLATGGFSPDLDGIYWDALGASGQSDYRISLAPEDRGPSGSYGLYKRLAVISQRAAQVTDGVGTAIATEFADEFLMDLMSWSAPWNVGASVVTALTHLPLWQTCFGEYAPTMAFDTVFCVNPVQGAYLKQSGVSLNIWWLGRQFVNGSTMTLADILDRPLPWFVQTGETNFSEWTLYHKPLLDWMKTATATLDQAVGPMRAYNRGKRLRPLVGSWDDYLDSRGMTPIVVDYLTGLAAQAADPFPGTAIHSCVRQTEEETGSPLAIFLSNFRPAAASVTIAMTPEDYPEMVASRVVLYSNVAGVRTLIQTFYGHVSYTTTVPAFSNAMFELLLENDTPPVVDALSDEEEAFFFLEVF